MSIYLPAPAIVHFLSFTSLAQHRVFESPISSNISVASSLKGYVIYISLSDPISSLVLSSGMELGSYKVNLLDALNNKLRKGITIEWYQVPNKIFLKDPKMESDKTVDDWINIPNDV